MLQTLQRIDRGDVLVLAPAGRLTIESSLTDDLKETVDADIVAGKKWFGIDGSELAYADSAGLGELVRCFTRIKRSGGQLVFAVPEGHHLRSRFKLTRLDRELVILPSVDDAVQSLEKQA